MNQDFGYVHRPENFIFTDGIFSLLDFLKRRKFLLVIITNQSGINHGFYTLSDFHAITDYMQKSLFARLNFAFDKVYFCPHAAKENCACRKPKPGMILRAVQDLGVDLKASFFIGDKDSDMQAAAAAGVGEKFWLKSGADPEISQKTGAKIIQNLAQIKDFYV